MELAIEARSVSKHFRHLLIPKHTTLKEALLKGALFSAATRQRTVHALTNVSFTARKGEAIGIVGRNGSGKTTLMRILARVMLPDSGSLALHGEIAPLLSLGVGFHPDLTGRENVRISGLILGLHPSQIEARMGDIAQFAEIGDFFDAPVQTYSSGMYARLAFSVAIHVDPDVLLLDEVFAVGDHAFNAKCTERMLSFRKQGKTIVLVSHDLTTMETFCDKVLWLQNGRVAAFGEPSEIISRYREAPQVSA